MMKTGADLEQTADAAPQLDTASRRFRNSAEDFQKRRLSGAIPADNANDGASLNVKANVSQGPKNIGRLVIQAVAATRCRLYASMSEPLPGAAENIGHAFTERPVAS